MTQNGGPGVTVLYVEDEEVDVEFMRFAFQRNGLANALHSVGNGRDAVNYLAGINSFADRVRHPLPALVLLDLNLPLLHGFEVLKWLRGRPEFAQLPVVVFSSSNLREDKAKAADLGANDYVVKPESGIKFLDVVQGLKEKWLS